MARAPLNTPWQPNGHTLLCGMNCLPGHRCVRVALLALGLAAGRGGQAQTSSYLPVKIEEPFDQIRQRMAQAKPAIRQAHQEFLTERYDLADRNG